MLMTYVFTLDSVFKSVSPKTQNLDKPVCFIHTIVLLIYVNESIYLLGNLPFFKIHVNLFIAWDDPNMLASLVAQMEKNLPAIQETWVQSLG